MDIRKLIILGVSLDALFNYITGRPLSAANLLLWLPLYVFLVLSGYLCYRIFVYPRYVSPYRKLPSPPNSHWLWGNYIDYRRNYYEHALTMMEKYPNRHFTRFNGLFGSDNVTLLSPEAHLMVLQTCVYDFPRPNLSMAYKIVIGNGLVFAEGEEHKLQRKLLTPAFSYAHVKKFVPVFMSKTKKVMNQFDKIVETGPTVFKVFPYFSRLTLDAIGEASFGVDLNSIEEKNSELVRAYDKISNAGEKFFPFYMFAFLPGWKYIPTAYNKEVHHARKIFSETCKNVLKEKKDKVNSTGIVRGKDGIYNGPNRDILSILLGNSDWSAEEVENQMMTFLFAGHETTAGAIAWALLTLAKHVDVQKKMRDEVRAAIPGGVEDIKTAEQIESLKYVNNVTRELLRCNPPVISTLRQASRDVIIDGETIYKGTNVNVSLKALNYSKKLWGADAHEFNPDRWDGRQADNAYAYMTFLQGTRSCIGKRFAEIEFKCILASFVARYVFEESVDNQPINRQFIVTVRPTDGLPLKVSKISGW